ncbi:MAG: Phage integrase, N-terminal SAM-like domain [Thermomicrobiales bacterium]|jgi:hypothetical protein|nr:Phage integrase, N-terminal SAM-like domain [Thermomicrobiales bacterium]
MGAQSLDTWLAPSVKPSVKIRTYEGYESIVRVRVVPRIGKKQLAKLTPLDLQSLYRDWRTRDYRAVPSDTRTASCIGHSAKQ